MLKQKLQQKLLQKLSPQQIQLIKLLEVPTIQLEQRIKKEIEENPVLEEGSDDEDEMNSSDDSDDDDDFSQDLDGEENENINSGNDDEFTLEDYISDEDIPNYKLSVNNYSKDDKKSEIPFSEGSTFQEHLETQLGLRINTDRQYLIGTYLLGNFDDDGYLRREIDAMVDDIAFANNIEVTEEEILKVLRIIQDFDPPGIGATSLQECLLIQINRKINSHSKNVGIVLAKHILEEYFNEFTKKHYDKIISRLNIDEKYLKEAITEILKLNPKPGSSFADNVNRSFQQIIPDFITEVYNGEIHLSLNSKNSPELRISRTYQDMLHTFNENRKKKTKFEKEAILFVKQKLDSAKWFIDAIKQRQNTLMLSMQAIIDYQNDYFLDGDEKLLRPMILKDIAERTSLDISTISRVANSKYIQTHFGIFPLKYFFSEGMQTDSGEEVSTREIKKILKDCIEAESKRRPLTDEKLAKILQEKGYQIARRTVAKYREQLNIPVARLRKKL
jgi:RNA polymerase sigma-54 factor